MKTRTIEQFFERQAWVVQDGHVVGLGVRAIAVQDYAASPIVMADSFGLHTTRAWSKWCREARN